MPLGWDQGPERHLFPEICYIAYHIEGNKEQNRIQIYSLPLLTHLIIVVVVVKH